MSEVKRYECNGSSSIFEDENGGLVDYGDYAALEAKCAALAAENAGLKEACGGDGSYRDCPACAHSEYIEAHDTPATDAFLAEIENKAIRKFINSIEHIMRDKLSPYDTEDMLEAMRIFLEEQVGEQK